MKEKLTDYQLRCEAIDIPLSTKIPSGMTVEEFLNNAEKVYGKKQYFVNQLNKVVQENKENYESDQPEKNSKGYVLNADIISKILSNKSKLTNWEVEFIENKTPDMELSAFQNTKFQEIATKALQ